MKKIRLTLLASVKLNGFAMARKSPPLTLIGRSSPERYDIHILA